LISQTVPLGTATLSWQSERSYTLSTASSPEPASESRRALLHATRPLRCHEYSEKVWLSGTLISVYGSGALQSVHSEGVQSP